MGVIEATKDEELVKAVLTGNVRAFDTLVERYFGMVYVLAYARLGHSETAEDLAQEVFLRAYLYLSNLDQPRYFSAWVSRITRNLASDWLRRGQRASRLIPMVPMEELPTEIVDTKTKGLRERMETEERDKSVHEAIMKLPPDLREVVMLHFAEGVSKTEIARLLRVHPATVGRHLTKALAQMKGMLEPILHESAPALRAPRKAPIRTIAIIGAAAAMSVKTKAALAAAAGGVTKLSSASLAKSGGTLAIGTLLSFLKTIPAIITTGGAIMSIKKGITITAVAVVALTAGTYLIHQQKTQKTTQKKLDAWREKKSEYERWKEAIKEKQHTYAVEHPEVIVAATNNMFDLIRNADYDAYDFSARSGSWQKFPAAGYYGVYTNWPAWAEWCCKTFKHNPIVSVTYGKVFMGSASFHGKLPAIPYKMTLRDGTVLEDVLYFEYELEIPDWIKNKTVPEGPFEHNPDEAKWFGYYGLDWHLR